MADVKKLQTRIALKYDTYTNWTDDTKEGLGANLVLLKGEIGLCEIPSGNANATTAPTVLFKVGDGETPFKTLKWASALAADVYSWAKASTVEMNGKKLTFVGGKPDGSDFEVAINYATPEEVAAAVKVVADDLSDLDARVVAVENKFTGANNVQGQIDALDGRLDTAEGKLDTLTGADTVDGSVAKALKDAKTETETQISTLVTSGQVKTNTDAIAQNKADIAAMDTAYKKAVSDEAKARDDADKAIDERLDKVEAFFEGAYTEDGQPVKEALDTLVEIQNFITGEGEAASDLIKSIEANATAIDALEKTLAEGGDFDKRVDDIEADVSANAGNITKLQGDVQKAQGDATQALADALAASNKVDTKAAEIKTAYEAYADGKASAADTAVAGLKTTLEAADAAITAEVDKKLATSDFNTWKGTHENGHAGTATQITAEIAAAVKVEEDARKAADAAIEKKIGGSYSETNTVAAAIAGVKTTADNAAADLAALTGDNGRVKAAENAIDALELIVNDASKGNAQLRTDVNALQELTKADGVIRSEIADAKKAGTDAAAAVEALSKGQVATNKTNIESLDGRVTAIANDYVKASDLVGDFYVFNCGTSTTVTHVVPEN